MDYSKIINFIHGRFSRCQSISDYYSMVNTWLTWYRGYDPAFHTIVHSNGITIPSRAMYRLNMGERVARDWASAVCCEPPQIVISSVNQRASIYVQGGKNNTGVLGNNNFNELFSLAVEEMFALGTSAIVTNIDNVSCDVFGNIVDASRGRLSITKHDALHIVPVSARNGVLYECAFVTEFMYEQKSYFILSVHVKEPDGYVIYNFVLDCAYNPSSYLFNTVPIMRTRQERPLFQILKPSMVNNVCQNSPMGISVYANAIDNIKACDQVFDACVRDVATGQRIILMNQCLLTRGNDGKYIVPQDVKQTYMHFFGDEAQAGVGEFIKDFSPKLNSAELDAELQNQLNMLSFKCGLGTHYYNFNRSGGITATQYAGERQDFIRNVRRINVGLAASVLSFVRSIIEIGASILGNGVDASAKVDVILQDGIVEDDTKAREQDRQDVKDGLMTKAEYRVKWYGESLEEAERKLTQIQPVSVI